MFILKANLSFRKSHFTNFIIGKVLLLHCAPGKESFFLKNQLPSSLILCQKCTARKYDSHNNCMPHFFSQIGSRKIVNTAVNAHIWSDILSAFSVCSGEVSNKSTNKFRVTSVNSTVCFPSFIPSTWRFLYIAIVSRASDSSQWFFFFYWGKWNSLVGFSFGRSVFLLRMMVYL